MARTPGDILLLGGSSKIGQHDGPQEMKCKSQNSCGTWQKKESKGSEMWGGQSRYTMKGQKTKLIASHSIVGTHLCTKMISKCAGERGTSICENLIWVCLYRLGLKIGDAFKITELSIRNGDDRISNAIQGEIMALYNQKPER